MILLNLILSLFNNLLNKSVRRCSLLIVVVVSANIYAGAPTINPSPSYPLVLKSGDISFNDTSGTIPEAKKGRPWLIGIPLWVPGYAGQFAVGGVEVGGESEGESIFDRLFSSEFSLDFYLVGSVNYHWQEWNFHGDVFAGTIGKSAQFTLTDKTVVDATLQVVMPRVYAGYDFLHDSAPLGPITRWQAYLGGRFYDLDLEVVLPGNLGTVDGGTSWFNLLIGTELNVAIINRLNLTISGDIGGFTGSNEPSLFGEVALHYRPWDLFSASLGYVAIHIDRVGESPEEIELKVDLAGPVLGIGFHF